MEVVDDVVCMCDKHTYAELTAILSVMVVIGRVKVIKF